VIARVVRKFHKHSENYEFVNGWPDAIGKLHARAQQLKDDQAEVYFF
jgi:hypothetical protein